MLFLLFAVAVLADQTAVDESSKDFQPALTGIKCVVSGKAVSGKYSCKYKKGKLFFDCGESRNKFLENRSQFIIKANHQLAVTGQYIQAKCPIKKVAVDRNHKQQIAGVELFFCCPACRQQMLGRASVHEQIRFIFDNQNFNSSFQPRSSQAKQSPVKTR